MQFRRLGAAFGGDASDPETPSILSGPTVFRHARRGRRSRSPPVGGYSGSARSLKFQTLSPRSAALNAMCDPSKLSAFAVGRIL